MNGYDYLKLSIEDSGKNGSIIFLDDEIEFVLERSIYELKIVEKSLLIDK
ncbi:MAG: hypothetical protein ACK5LV_05260 [Lachnospirales bacterium]